MMPHLPYTFLLAALTAGATALPGRRPGRERVCHAIYVFGASAGAVLAGAWIMLWIHG